MSLYHLRYYTQAIEAWTKLRDGFPQTPETIKAEYQIGDTLFRAQRYKEAIRQYRHIISKYTKSKQLPLAYLRVAMSAGLWWVPSTMWDSRPPWARAFQRDCYSGKRRLNSRLWKRVSLPV